MKNEIPFVMERTIYTYIFLLCISLIVKIVGFDYFGLDLSNPFMTNIEYIMKNNMIINNIVYFIPLLFTQYIMLSLFCNSKDRKLRNIFLLNIPILYIIESYKITLFGNYSGLIEIMYFYILCFIYNKNVNIKIFIKYLALFLILQIISCCTRYNISLTYVDNIIANLLLNVDYIICLILLYKINFMKGDENSWEDGFQVAHSLYLGIQTLLTKSSKLFQIKFSNKKDKFEFILTLILYLFWNIFTLIVIFLIAMLNDTIIECIFILSSFWLNKTVFGKAFHLKNIVHCFIISNLTYYCLNRICTPLNISIIVPIILGILLSYFTSKLTKKNQKKLYRGMKEEDLKYWLDKVTNNYLDYKICKLYYVDRYSEIKVAAMTNYSVENIKRRKRIVNDLLKELII